MESHRKGDLTEAIVLAELKRRGVATSFPFGDNERYDAVVEAPNGRLYKLQIKTGWLDDGVVNFHGRSSHTNSEGNVYKQYDGDVDYFTVYCHELESLYLVPEDQVGASMKLRVEPPKRPDPKINRAAAYRFNEMWPPEDGIEEMSEYESWTESKDRSITCVLDTLEKMGVTAYRKAHGAGVCDIVTDGPTGSVRMTVRTVTESEGRIQLSRTPDVDSRRDTDDTDYYALYCPSREQTYLVDSEAFGSSLSLRTEEPEQVQQNTRWADDHRLEVVWPPDGLPVRSSLSALGAVRDRFESMGVPVGVVHDESVPYDVLAERAGRFVHVAVVTGHVSRGCIRLRPDSCDGVDAFVVYHRDGDTCYVVEATEFDRSISLRVTPPEKPDQNINWAAEYELGAVW